MNEKALNPEIIQRLLRQSSRKGSVTSVTQLAGDASTRRYFRVAMNNGSTYVIMAAPDTGQTALFAGMTELMQSLNVDTPGLFAVDDKFALLEDCGDNLLQNEIATLDAAGVEREYRRAIDDLVKFQQAAIAAFNTTRQCFNLAFDVEKLMWEINFANTHFIEGYLGLESNAHKAAMEEWEKIIGDLAARMEVLAHRDFHCRNILCLRLRRVWIDYQDARMGRRLYDLASLLFDPYAALPEETVMRLADYYYETLSQAVKPEWDKERFYELLNLSALQRIYKALGTYGFQTSVRKVSTYVPYIEPSVKIILRLTDEKVEFRGIRELMKQTSERLNTYAEGTASTRRS